MAQTLYVKVTGKDGKISLKEVNVIRAWQESDGRQIYLHANGVYGYKDGAPVKSAAEFAIIGSPLQHKLAHIWWDKVGQDMSAGYYARLEEEIEKRQMEGLPDLVVGDVSDLDSTMYMRRPIRDKRRKAFSEPSTWPEFEFPTRPDWWGFAGMIEMGIWRYEKVEVEEDGEEGEHRTLNIEHRTSNEENEENEEKKPDKERSNDEKANEGKGKRAGKDKEKGQGKENF